MKTSDLFRNLLVLASAAVALLAVVVRFNVTRELQQLLIPSTGVANHIHADVAIVLGYALRRNGTLTKPLRTRVEVGVQLYEQRAVQYLLFSGGHPGGGVRVRSEAAAMAAYAYTHVHAAVNTSRWLLEERSTSTRENAVYSLHMAAVRSLQSAVLVTNPFHQLRSLLTFRCAAKTTANLPGDFKIVLAFVPPESSRGHGVLVDELWLHYDMAREVAALMYYWIKGWLC